MMNRDRLPETEVAKRIIAHLESLNWDVYQEVSHRNGYRADIVAKRGCLVWIIETKVTFGLNAIEDATHWFQNCHMVSVGTIWTRSMNGFGKKICEHFGIGILTVSSAQSVKDVNEELRPAFRRRIPLNLLPKVHEEHKTYAAAGSNGGYFSPFQRTARLVQDQLRNRPDGMTMKELIHAVDHHYASEASARQSLKQWIEAGKISNVEAIANTRPLKVRMATTPVMK